jgi:hypothetical protein
MITQLSQRSIFRGCQGSGPLWKTAPIASNAVRFSCRCEKITNPRAQSAAAPSGGARHRISLNIAAQSGHLVFSTRVHRRLAALGPALGAPAALRPRAVAGFSLWTAWKTVLSPGAVPPASCGPRIGAKTSKAPKPGAGG